MGIRLRKAREGLDLTPSEAWQEVQLLSGPLNKNEWWPLALSRPTLALYSPPTGENMVTPKLN